MDNLIQVPSDKLIADSYLTYGDYVNSFRAIPNVYDGLKPSYKRLIQTAYSKIDKDYTKTADLLGQNMSCFTGDTEIMDINGDTHSFSDLVNRDLDNNPVYVFSATPDKVEVSRVKKVWSNGTKNNILEVTLDNGESFKCTSDHLILKLDGEYSKAEGLVVGDRLLPFELSSCNNSNEEYINSLINYHKVVSIRYLDTSEEVFDLEVDSDIHNFSLACGIFAHNCFHPHGSDSLKEVVSNLVHLGIFDGQGNFGYKHIDGDVQGSAAIRYTEIRLNKYIRDQFDMVSPYIPTIPSYKGEPEWLYVPTPIPFSLVSGALGIALGVGTRIPPFTMHSLLEAYRKDNPDLLELNYGYVLSDKAGIRTLWNDGVGRLKIQFKLEPIWEDQYGFLISGVPEIFTLPMARLNEWMQQGLVFWRDESDEIPKMFVSRVKRTRRITDEELYNYLQDLTTKMVGYRIRVTYDKVVRNIGIKDWIDATYKNYINLISKYQSENLKQLDTQKEMWSHFKDIADRLINRMPVEQVAQELNISKNIVDMVGRKAINTLLNADPQKELLRIDDNIKYFNNINSEDMITNFVERGFNGATLEN